MSHAATLEAHSAQLLVVDLQVKLLPSIQDQEQTLAMSRQLIRTAGIFDLPVTVTQQYTKGLGETDPLINDALNDVTHTRFEKLTFCCSADEKVREHLAALDRRQGEVRPFEEVKTELLMVLVREHQDRALRERVEQLRAEAEIRILDPALQ